MRKILLLAVIAIASFSVKAGNDYECYNIKRAGELIDEQKYKDAAEYLDREIEKNPTNGFAWFYYSMAYYGNRLYDSALTSINKAIPLLQKDCNKEYMSYVLWHKASAYYAMENWNSAIDCYSESISLNKSSDNAYYWRGMCYYKQSRNSSCMSDMSKVVSINGGFKYQAYEIMGEINWGDKKYEAAIPYFTNVIEGSDDVDIIGKAYSHRASCNWELGKKRQAVEDAIESSEAGSRIGYLLLQYYATDSSIFPLIKAKINAKENKSDNKGYWKVTLADCYASRNETVESIRHYVDAANEDGVNDLLNNRIYGRLRSLCDFENATYFYNLVLEEEEDKINEKVNYAYRVLDPANKGREAIAFLDECIKEAPDNNYAYYVRARIKRYQNRFNEAIADYSMAIMLDDEYPYSYNERADCYKKIGKDKQALADYNTVISLLKDSDEHEDCLIYALLYTGKKADARKLMTKRQAEKGFNEHYDAACVWSLLGETSKAISALENALNNGYRDFNHINRDDDLDNIRNLPQFKSLISKYQAIHRQELAQVKTILKDYPFNSEIRPSDDRAAGTADFERIPSGNQNHHSLTNTNKVSVPFTKEGGVTKVKCSVNGLPLSFIFDTGASKVTISSIEATFMYKNGYLSASDFGNSEYFSTASGEVTEGTVVTLRTVEIGGVKLSNVRATVVHNQNAPLLLGQSALSRLGKIEIDNLNNCINIQPR